MFNTGKLLYFMESDNNHQYGKFRLNKYTLSSKVTRVLLLLHPQLNYIPYYLDYYPLGGRVSIHPPSNTYILLLECLLLSP